MIGSVSVSMPTLRKYASSLPARERTGMSAETSVSNSSMTTSRPFSRSQSRAGDLPLNPLPQSLPRAFQTAAFRSSPWFSPTLSATLWT